MSEEFFVSVITPVYNAAEFVTRAVESALAQPETGEVLLIEDNSPDDSLSVCQELASKYDKVRLLRHPDGGNHGAGASRNLGMQNARFDYIAFVDADNFYLENRFLETKKVFETHPDCEGVYEAIGIHVENEKALERWTNAKRQSPNTLITLSGLIPPDKLAGELISGKIGSLTLDGFVLRANLITQVGLMSTQLRLHQDTEFLIRCAITGRLYPGLLSEPVAMEGVHEKNRFSAPRSQAQELRNKMTYWMSLYNWSKENASPLFQKEIRNRMIDFVRGHKYFNKFPRHLFPTRLIWFTRLLRLFLYPKLLFEIIVNK